MSEEKITLRQLKAVETKKKIYAIADQLFKKHGFDNVSVDTIVEMAGVSKGAFYVHFESKNALISELVSDFVQKVDLDYRSYLNSLPADTSASEILLAFVEKIAEMLTKTLGYDLIKIAYESQLTKAVNPASISGYDRELYKMFDSILRKGIAQGEFESDLPIDTISKHFLIAFRGLTYEWCIRYPEFDYREEAVRHFRMMLRGIKKK